MELVRVEKLNKTYPAFALRDVSFTINEGRIAGFIGRNGAGKTTTIKSMLNLVRPDSGEISFFGKPLKGNEAFIKQRTGYSSGIVNWYPRKKIRTLADTARDFYESWDEKAYNKYLRLFALDGEKTPVQLSEGMKVKCNLLFALSHGARILILDEPTSGLDPFSRDELTDLFGELKRQGVAIFFSTHIISDIEKCADDIIYISNGRILAAEEKDAFRDTYSTEHETLEETFLRLERGRMK